MKKHLQLSALFLAMGLLLFAQETTEVSVKVSKDGKIVKDTTYTFEDASEAKHALKMMDAMASGKLDIHIDEDGGHEMHLSKEGGSDHHKKIVVISEDGKKLEDVDEEHMKWITSSVSEDGVSERVIIMKMDGEGTSHGHTYVTSGDKNVQWTSKEGEEGKVKVIVKEIDDGDKGEIKKEIMIVSNEEEDEGEWTVKEIDKGNNVQVIVIKKVGESDDEQEIEIELKEIKEKKKSSDEKVKQSKTRK